MGCIFSSTTPYGEGFRHLYKKANSKQNDLPNCPSLTMNDVMNKIHVQQWKDRVSVAVNAGNMFLTDELIRCLLY